MNFAGSPAKGLLLREAAMVNHSIPAAQSNPDGDSDNPPAGGGDRHLS
jgi:hypothetical protein